MQMMEMSVPAGWAAVIVTVLVCQLLMKSKPPPSRCMMPLRNTTISSLDP